jgi:DNA-binding SARP family transcriptional activator
MTDRRFSERRLSLLGGFRLSVGDEVVDGNGAGQRVLAYLAVRCRRQPVRRCALAEELWADVPAAQASSSLRSVMWRLPRPEGRRLVVPTGPSDLSLADDVVVDVWEVERAAAVLACTGEHPVAKGPLLDDLSGLTTELLPGWDEEWLVLEREAHRQTRMHYLEQIAQHRRRRGQFAGSLDAALRAAVCDPLRESAHRHVIQTHLAEGNVSEALRHFKLYRRMLADELGLSPSPAMRGLVAHAQGRPVDTVLSAVGGPAPATAARPRPRGPTSR